MRDDRAATCISGSLFGSPPTINFRDARLFPGLPGFVLPFQGTLSFWGSLGKGLNFVLVLPDSNTTGRWSGRISRIVQWDVCRDFYPSRGWIEQTADRWQIE